MERTNKLPLATIIEEDEEEFSLDLSPSTSVKTKPVQRPSSSAAHPKYITELLAKVGDRLSLFSATNSMLRKFLAVGLKARFTRPG